MNLKKAVPNRKLLRVDLRGLRPPAFWEFGPHTVCGA